MNCSLVFVLEILPLPNRIVTISRSLFQMISNSKLRTPFSPIIFDYANFLISSGKVEDISSYGPISARLGSKTETFLKDMKDFWINSATLKTPFSLDKVSGS